MSGTIRLDQKNEKFTRILTDFLALIDEENKIEGIAPLKKIQLSNLGLIPDGGTTGQVLKKTSDDDLDIEWGDGGGSGGTEERLKTNMIIVNENAIRNIGGKLYSNLTACITCINSITPAPSITNPWTIVVEGDYNPATEESILLPEGCVITGTGGNTIGANVTIDSPPISIMSSMMDKINATGLNSIIFKGTLNISYKGLDPATGDTQPYLTGLSAKNTTFSPSSITGTGLATMVFQSLHSNIIKGDYTGFCVWMATQSVIVPLDGNIYISSFQFLNCTILSMVDYNPDYGLSFVNAESDDGPHVASNCYCVLSKPANSYVFDGNGTFQSCTMAVAWDGIKSRNLSFYNCYIIGSQEIGTEGVDDNALQVYSGREIRFRGGNLEVYPYGIIELLADDGEQASAYFDGVLLGNDIEIKKTMSGTTGTSYVGFNKILNLDVITIDASVDTVVRRNCLWDDAPATDESNFYSAKKIHDLIT